MTAPQHINDLQKYSLTSGARDVNIQDQVTPPLIVPFNKTTNTTTLSAATAIDDRTITVAATTGFVDGAFVTISSIGDNRYYIGRQIGAPVGNVITVDTPLDFAYPIGATAATGAIYLNVNGSVTPQVFSIRASDPGIPVTIDITRIIFQCTTATAVDLSKFGDIAGGLVNGLVLRRVDGTTTNIFNVKTNGELAAIMYDFTIYQGTNPVQGVDGFLGRITFAGQEKMGVAIRLGTGEDLEVIVQDNLSTLTEFLMIAEGHVVI